MRLTSASTTAVLVAVTSCFLSRQRARAAEGDTPQQPQGLLPVPDYSGNPWNRADLTGDWYGARTDLANKGIQLDVDYTQYMQSIVSGGIDATTAYGGHLDYLVHLDLMRMGVLPGALITIRGESRYGESVNGDTGAVLPVNTTAFFPLTPSIDEDVPIAVTELNYTQFLSEKFAVTLGKFQTLDADLNEFASGCGKSQFMNANFLFDSVAALRLPYSSLGVGVLWMPTKHITITSSVINTADSSQTTGFEDFGSGTTWSSEVDVQYRLRDLPGGMNFGALYSFDPDFAQIGGQLIFQPGQGLSINNKDSTWALYWSTWQYLFLKDASDKPIDLHDGVPDHEGFGLFARAGIADQQTNPVEWSASIGLGGRGMIPTRQNDVFGIGYYYASLQTTRISGAVGIEDHAQGVEVFYNIAITPAAHLTFDVQALESAQPNTDTAVILGIRLNLTF